MEDPKITNPMLTPEEAIRLFELGLTYNKLHNHDEALIYFHQSLQISMQLNNNILTDKIISNIGNAYDLIAYKQLDPLEYRLNSIAIMRETLPDIPSASAQIARILNNIGDEFLKAGQYHDSLDYFLQAWKSIKDRLASNHPYISVIRSNIALVCNTMNNAGSTCIALEQYVEALRYFSRSFDTLQKLFPENAKNIQLVYSNLIKTCAKLHEIGKQYLQINKQKEALNIFINISDAMLQSLVLEPAINIITSKKK